MSNTHGSQHGLSHTARDWLSRIFGSSGLGVGTVLVIVPAVVLWLGLATGLLDRMRLIGLPLLAILGIVLLFGTLALVAMLFQSLGLHDRREALALPPGSIRAAIALALIVLFAIISIMLFQSMLGQPYVLKGFDRTQRDALVMKAPERVIEVVPAACAASLPTGAACAEADQRFDLHLQGGSPPSGASDLAKQLLVLVGTLMTSVTSFYFATRGSAEARRDEPAAPAAAVDDAEGHVDGCDVPITEATPDSELPPARGGVAPPPAATGG